LLQYVCIAVEQQSVRMRELECETCASCLMLLHIHVYGATITPRAGVCLGCAFGGVIVWQILVTQTEERDGQVTYAGRKMKDGRVIVALTRILINLEIAVCGAMVQLRSGDAMEMGKTRHMMR
jgi:hypothetical protein